jgi:gamma-glutamyltranspeptidase / glutathione hydrolase / leukotriene-C4 hydrolase
LQSHISIVDQWGIAVAITSTVNLVFGSQVLDPITGVILNDELDDFSSPGRSNAFGLWPSPCKRERLYPLPPLFRECALCNLSNSDRHMRYIDNYPAPGKRPLSSTCPTILEHPDGSLYLALGGSGGSRIFGSVAQVILGADAVSSASAPRVEQGWVDLSAAVEAPRAHDQLFPLMVDMDSTFDQASVDALRARGHNTTGERRCRACRRADTRALGISLWLGC